VATLVVTLVATLEKLHHHVDEAVVVFVRPVGRALHEQPPARVALGGVGGVGVAQLSVVVQERRELCDSETTRVAGYYNCREPSDAITITAKNITITALPTAHKQWSDRTAQLPNTRCDTLRTVTEVSEVRTSHDELHLRVVRIVALHDLQDVRHHLARAALQCC
jgi:hypothetical protein